MFEVFGVPWYVFDSWNYTSCSSVLGVWLGDLLDICVVDCVVSCFESAGDGMSDFFSTLKSEERIGLGDGCFEISESVIVMNCMSSSAFCGSMLSELNIMDRCFGLSMAMLSSLANCSVSCS